MALISGRRGQAPFFIWGARELLKLNLFLWLVCPVYFFCSYYGEIAHFGAPLGQQIAPLFAAPGLPWTSAFSVTFCAALFVFGARSSLNALLPRWVGDRLTLRQMRVPLLLCLLSSVSFFASFLLLHWPFTGLPQGLAWEQALPAILRHAMRNYFMAFSAAGAVALLALFPLARNMGASHLSMAVRYFAFWAAAGLIPHWLITWGMRLGSHGKRVVGQGVASQDPALILLSLALFCWAFLLWKPSCWRSLGVVAFIMLLARAALPYLRNLI